MLQRHTFIVLGCLVALVSQGEESNHPVDTAELRYEGAPTSIKDVQMRLTPGAPDISEVGRQRRIFV